MAQNLTNFTLHNLFKPKDLLAVGLKSARRHHKKREVRKREKSQGLNFQLLTKGSIFSAPMRRCSYATHYTFAAPYQEDTLPCRSP